MPSAIPSQPVEPSISSRPTGAVAPSAQPSTQPSLAPNAPSAEPSAKPSVSSPTVVIAPSAQPSTQPSFAPSEQPTESTCPQLTVYFDDDGGNTPFQEIVVSVDTLTIETSFKCPFEATTDVGVVALVDNDGDCAVECLYFIPVSNYQEFCNGNQGSSYNFDIPVQPDYFGLTFYFGYLDEGSALTCQQPLELTTGCSTPSIEDYAPFFDDFENSFSLEFAIFAAEIGGVEVFFSCSEEATTNIAALAVDDVSCQVGCLGFVFQEVCNEANFGELFLFIEGDFPDGQVLAVGYVADDFILDCEQEIQVLF
jgi:hypothetical protein